VNARILRGKLMPLMAMRPGWDATKVLRMGDRLKMARIYTRWVPAQMIKLQMGRDWPHPKLICNPVCLLQITVKL
jgi:hypothetical protein